MLTDLSNGFTWPTKFSCVLMLDDMILPNDYTLTVSMLPSSIHSDSTIVGLKKIKTFITKYVHNATLISSAHVLFDKLTLLNTNVIQMPHEPHDYFFASLLYRKLSNISNNYFDIVSISVDSSIGDRVQYQVTDSCITYDYILNENNWWNQDSTQTNTFGKFPSWDDLDVSTTSRVYPVLLRGGKDESKSV